MSLAELPLGEKLRLIRKDRGLSLENIAHDTGCSVATLSRLERGEADVDGDTLAAIRAALGVENAPVLDHEIEHYKSRMWLWNELITTWRTDEAKAMHKEMATILDLPYERGHQMLYTQTEISLLLFDENNASFIEDKMAKEEKHIDEMDNEARHLYYTNKGILYLWYNDYIKALQHLLVALELKSDIFAKRMPSLLTNIGVCYSRIGRTFNAILFLERAVQAFDGDLTNALGPIIDINLATLYVRIGELNKAKKLTNESLVQARRVNHKTGIGVCYRALANISSKRGDYTEAIKLFDQSFKYSASDIQVQWQILYDKACCMFEAKDYHGCAQVVKQGKGLASENEDFTLLFESMEHLLNLKSSESEYFIESTTIPNLKNRHDSTPALFFCEKLEEHYRRKKSNKRAMAMVEISRDIYRGMTMSEEMVGV